MDKILLTAEEASKLLGISTSTLQRLSKQNILRKRKISDRRVVWLKSELIEFAQSLPTSE